MSLIKPAAGIFLLLLGSVCALNANAITFNFTGECDDCAFAGDPSDAGFNPIGDGLTESVSGTLTLNGLRIDSDGFFNFGGVGSITFNYNGSSLINPFGFTDPFTFTPGLLESGDVTPGFEFRVSSSVNTANPGTLFSFPNFCTALGEQVLNRGVRDNCSDIGLVHFTLDSAGNWSIFGEEAFDIGGGGQLVPSAVPLPAAAWLFGTALIGLVGLQRRRAPA